MGLLQNHALHAPVGRLLHDGSSSNPTYKAHKAYKVWHQPSVGRRSFFAGLALLLFTLLIVLAEQSAGIKPQTKAGTTHNIQLTEADNPTKTSDVAGQNASSGVPSLSGTTAGSSVSSSISSSVSGSQPSVKVTVNGQDVPVSPNGSSQQTVTTPGGSVNVSTQDTTQGSTDNSSTSSTSVNVSSDSFNSQSSISLQSSESSP